MVKAIIIAPDYLKPIFPKFNYSERNQTINLEIDDNLQDVDNLHDVDSLISKIEEIDKVEDVEDDFWLDESKDISMVDEIEEEMEETISLDSPFEIEDEVEEETEDVETLMDDLISLNVSSRSIGVDKNAGIR